MACNGKIYECRARGLLRRLGQKPLVGDSVEFAVYEQGLCYIESINERKSVLLRPAVANVTDVCAVIAASRPEPDLLLVDKLLIWAAAGGITPHIIINKCDEQKSDIAAQYRLFDTLCISAKTGEGMEELAARLRGKTAVFCGQSAVGKSTILNALLPGAFLETGGLSRKTDRGRHTTRTTELLVRGELALIDTPGFSVLSELPVEEEEGLGAYYPEFSGRECYYACCLHLNEPDCGVKAALEAGEIDKERYKRYLDILKEIKEKRTKKYD